MRPGWRSLNGLRRGHAIAAEVTILFLADRHVWAIKDSAGHGVNDNKAMKNVIESAMTRSRKPAVARVLFAAAATVLMGLAVTPFTVEQAGAQHRPPPCTAGETPRVARYKIEKGENLPAAIKRPLTGKPGNAKKGVEWMVDRRQGNCVSCHQVSKILALVKEGDHASESKYGNHGTIAPTLDGVADRYSEAELRMIVVDAKKAFPDFDTSMPTYHRKTGFERVLGPCKGKAILSAGRVEDIVAYLATLKDE